MKFLHAAAFAVILTVTGAPILSAQEPQQDKDKPKQQEEEKKKQPPAPRKSRKPSPTNGQSPSRNPIKKNQGKTRTNRSTSRKNRRKRRGNSRSNPPRKQAGARLPSTARGRTFAAFRPNISVPTLEVSTIFACSEAATVTFGMAAIRLS